MIWISVKDDLPEYNKPVFLKNKEQSFVGMRDRTDVEGEYYLLLKKPNFSEELGGGKMTHWAVLEIPAV